MRGPLIGLKLKNKAEKRFPPLLVNFNGKELPWTITDGFAQFWSPKVKTFIKSGKLARVPDAKIKIDNGGKLIFGKRGQTTLCQRPKSKGTVYIL